MGGGEVIRMFMQEGLADEYAIYLMPTVLGNGIPLFPSGFPKADLQLESVKKIEGIEELIYRRQLD